MLHLLERGEEGFLANSEFHSPEWATFLARGHD
jgi:hypothetical protein